MIENIKKRKHLKIYHLILILTDGRIHDLRETINLVVRASDLPISFVIVGIGENDFGKMEELDADVHELVDSDGFAARRDIVQFLKFNDFLHDHSRLAEEVLEEIPEQFLGYMADKGHLVDDVQFTKSNPTRMMPVNPSKIHSKRKKKQKQNENKE